MEAYNQSVIQDDVIEHTSTALQTSFSVLQRAIPSTTAPAISSTYFSRDKDSISFMIWSWFSVPRDCRNRLMRAVCRFRDESNALAGSRCIHLNAYLSRLSRTLHTRTGFIQIQLLQVNTFQLACLFFIALEGMLPTRAWVHNKRTMERIDVVTVKDQEVRTTKYGFTILS